MFDWWGLLNRRWQRQIDKDTLWPICLDEAPDVTHAKAAFAIHVLNDPAWTTDFTESQLTRMIDDL